MQEEKSSPNPGPDAGLLTPASDEPWYAIWTRSRAEKVVLEQLVRKDIEAFLPTMRRLSRWKDRKKEVEWPLFPGYCFARFDPAHTLPILKCAGVATIITVDGKPAPIAPEEIVAIQRLVATHYKFDPCPLIKEGDLVEVMHGPLKGVVGRLVRKNEQARLVLSITMINRAVEVVFDVADVRKY